MRRAYKTAGKVCGVPKVHIGALLTQYLKWASDYQSRVDLASGEIQGYDVTKAIYKIWQDSGLYDSLWMQVAAEGGLILRDSGVEKFVSKAFDFSQNNRDNTQTTEVEQPFLGGRIAPNERYCFRSVTGANLSLNHPSLVVSSTHTVIGVLKDETVGKTEVSFTEASTGTLDEITWTGDLYLYAIIEGAISDKKQASVRSDMLNLFNEIETVQIGTQHWSTSNFQGTETPMGNGITEVTDNTIWASAQTLYDNAITGGATVYEATQAAAMWCYYNNDSEIGATYGKLYNWFAVSLLQQDIDLFNAANPENTWGWHVPSQAEFETLQTYLGGSDVAGGKMKKEGFDYWNSPNEGADNSSGFTVLGGGYRKDTGSYSSINSYGFAWTTTLSGGNANRLYLSSSSEQIVNIGAVSKIRGLSLRLIKD